MSKANSQDRKSIAKKRAKTKNTIITIIGLVVIISSAVMMFTSKSVEIIDSVDAFSSGDLEYASEPYIAIHEMNGSALDQIQFIPKDEPQPQIAVSEDFFDFGPIGATDIVTHEFFIQNVGEAPLTISRAYTTCGCTTAEFSATVIPPGKMIQVTLILDAGYHDVAGETVRRGIIIENNDPDMPQFELWTQANVGNN